MLAIPGLPIGIYVRNGVDLFEIYPNVDAGKEASKVFWGQRSILAFDFDEPKTKAEIISAGDSLDGCHLYPSGVSIYKPLACLPANIWPMPRSDHRLWDSPALSINEKIRLLTTHAYHEERLLVREIVSIVKRLADACR